MTYILWGAFQKFNAETEILLVNPIKMKDPVTKSLEQLKLSSHGPKISPILLPYPGCVNFYEKSINLYQISGIARQ